MSIFDPLSELLDKLKSFFNSVVQDVENLASALVENTLFLLDLKANIKSESKLIADEVKGIYADAEEFAKLAKSLKSRVVRADVAFNVIHQIFSGELKKFFTETVAKLFEHQENNIDGIISTLQSAGLLKKPTLTSGLAGPLGAVERILEKLIKGYSFLSQIIAIIKGLLPVIKEIRKKLQEFEKIIMPQKSKVEYQSVRFKFRTRRPVPKLEGIEIDPKGTLASKRRAQLNIRELSQIIRDLEAIIAAGH